MTGGASLLASLQERGVIVALNAAGDGLTLTGKGKPPAHLLDEVRAAKVELLEALRPAKKEAERPTPSSSPVIDPLPAHLAELLEAAHAGQLQKGAVKLTSGLVTDLAVYVKAWAVGWPYDRAHRLRRLEEAHAVTVRP